MLCQKLKCHEIVNSPFWSSEQNYTWFSLNYTIFVSLEKFCFKTMEKTCCLRVKLCSHVKYLFICVYFTLMCMADLLKLHGSWDSSSCAGYFKFLIPCLNACQECAPTILLLPQCHQKFQKLSLRGTICASSIRTATSLPLSLS